MASLFAQVAVLLAALAFGPSVVAGRRMPRRRVELSMQQPAGQSVTVQEDDFVPPGASSSRTYLIATFPDHQQVAYCHVPDNVWRPLVTGDLVLPSSVAVDSQNGRLFVADQNSSVVWHYSLAVRPNGLLETSGPRRAAVQGYSASWIAVSSIGDLYFVGRATPEQGAADPFDAIFRMDAQDIARGDPLNPVEVYNRANTGSPSARVWMPSGLAVDSFYIYWGNSEAGTEHGSVNKGSRMNVGLRAQDMNIAVLNEAFDGVRGLTATGTHIFFLTPSGVHGVLKTDTSVTNPALGLIATENGGNATGSSAASAEGNFTAISWDGGNTLYVTATGAAGSIYSLPALNTQAHSLEKFVDAPGVQGVAMYLHVQSPGSNAPSRAPAAVTLLALGAATAAGTMRFNRG